jgi:multiple sugar transport system substrate-binding protein
MNSFEQMIWRRAAIRLRWMGLCLLLIGLPANIQAQETEERVVIGWYVGLGQGVYHMDVQEKIAADFNNSQDAIELEVVCTCGGETSFNALDRWIRVAYPLDIIGPMSFDAANRLTQTGWLDLQPLVDAHGFDLAQYPPNVIETYRSPNGLSALPIATDPGVLYYNSDLFDAAGLNYPPTVPGEAYIMPDGSQVPWDYDTVVMIGMHLTLDNQGHDATHPDFDPDNIVQFGFIHQWDSLRSDFHTFGVAPVVNENGQVVIPEQWRAQAHWLWHGMWVDHFIPNADQEARLYQETGYNAFATGHVAMARTMAWFTCCLDELNAHWDIALQPAYQGTIYSPMDVNSFYIHKSTLYPDEAFTVLEYLLGPAAPELLDAYWGFPARLDLQQSALARYQERYPGVQNWEVFTASIPFAPVPHQESGYPNFAVGQDRFWDFLWMLRGENGASIDLDAELDKLEADLQILVNAEARP